MIDFVFYDPKNPNIMLGKKMVAEDDIWLQGHYEGYPIFPGHCQLECAQLVTAILAKRIFPEKKGLPIAVGVVGVRWKNIVHPNDQLTIQVEFVKEKAGIFFCEGEIKNQHNVMVMVAKNIMGIMKE
jgi:3-hydroxyacyl-[acyl-carrier-protein] dehydratase